MTPPKCEKCGGRTYLSRSEPLPEGGEHGALQTFRCASCEHCQQQEQHASAAE